MKFRSAELIKKHKIKLKKALGQNLLLDPNINRKLVQAADIGSADSVFEVGAGAGDLTELISEHAREVLTVEIDYGLESLLRERFDENPRVRLFIGDVLEAWDKASDLSDKVHIIYKDRAYNTILGLAPEMYDDIWVAGKVMYKLEPIAADGGTVIIYAPHITEISYTHGKILDEIGYHTRDYFLKQMDKFAGYPRGVVAHSTHVKGIGTFVDGVEKPRVNVVLATGISEERCRKVNLGYMNPDDVDISAYQNREDQGVLVVPHAGELLHRLSDGSVPTISDT